MGKINSHGARIKGAIVAAGLNLWRLDPASVSARKIGQMLNMTHSAILYHFGSTETLKAIIAAEAVRLGDREIVPGLIVANHPATAGLTPAQRQDFLSNL